MLRQIKDYTKIFKGIRLPWFLILLVLVISMIKSHVEVEAITITASIIDGTQNSIKTDELIRKILLEKQRGCSVRRAIVNLANGDEKLMLRMQNKYRNLLKKQPERIARIAQDLGFPAEADFLQKKIEREIDALYSRIALDLRRENEFLRAELEKLRREKKA